MSHRAQRWFVWFFIAFVAVQIYVVREWLAGLLLMAVLFAGVVILGAVALVLNAAWNAGRSAMAVVAAYFAKMGIAKPVLVTSEIADSKPSDEEPVLWI